MYKIQTNSKIVSSFETVRKFARRNRDGSRYKPYTYVFRDLRCGAVGGLTEGHTDSAEKRRGGGRREAPLPRQIEEEGQQ